MTFNAFFIGVGGEGVLTAAAIVAQAAHLDGQFVRGVQLHGLAQRGGSIPTIVRFGKESELSSPGIREGGADIVFAFEPLEAVRAVHYADKSRTSFVINDYPHMPVYANLMNLPYPKMAEIHKRVKPFAKKVLVFNTHELALKKLGSTVLGNTMLLGAAVGAGLLPLKPESMRASIRSLAKRQADENVKAFDEGLLLGRRGK